MLENPEKWPKFGKCDPKNPQNENNFSLYTLFAENWFSIQVTGLFSFLSAI